jgi:hypothetical protein
MGPRCTGDKGLSEYREAARFFAEIACEKVGTTIGFPDLVMREPAWILTMEVIGQKLRERYPQQPNDLPPRLLAFVEKLDEKSVRDTSAGTSKVAEAVRPLTLSRRPKFRGGRHATQRALPPHISWVASPLIDQSEARPTASWAFATLGPHYIIIDHRDMENGAPR